MKTTMQKRGGTLVADNQQAADILSKVPESSDVMVDVIRSRNVKFHKKFFAFLNCVFDMQHHFISVEALRFWMIMKAGYVESISAPNGHLLYKPKSIAFHSMEEDDFAKLYSACLDVVLAEFDLDRDAIQRVVDFA